MTRSFLAVAVLLPVLLVTAPAARADSELYGGIGIGYSTFSVDAIDFEGSALATRQFIGFRYGDYVGLEAGYINFGTVNDRIIDVPGQVTLNQGIETWGYNLSLIGTYPLNEELYAFGKLGAIRWDSEVELQGFPRLLKDDGDGLIGGIGLDYRGTGRFRLRIEGELVDIDFADTWWVATISVIYGIPIDL